MRLVPSPERLARLAVRHPWRVLTAWGVAIIVGAAAAASVGSVLTTEARNFVETESVRADDFLEDRLWGALPGRETVVVQSTDRTVGDPDFRAFVERLTADLRGLTADVAAVTNAYEAPGVVPVSADGRATLIPVTLRGTALEADKHVAELLADLAKLDGRDGFTVVTVGDGSVPAAFTEQSEEDLQKAELVGVPIAILVLTLVFGALVAAGLPLVLGLVSIAIAVGVSAVAGRAFELSIFLVNFVTTMGLAVGVDYALLVIKRVREERSGGLSRDEAIIHAGATASRAVLFSGLAVIVALLGLMIVPNNIFRSLSFGAIVVVAVAVAAALTLLPAVLRLLGDGVNRGRLRVPFQRPGAATGTSFWDRTTGIVMAHPWASVILSAGLLVAAAVPYATIKLGWNGVSTLPRDTVPYRAYSILDAEFSAGLAAPVRVVVVADDVTLPDVSRRVAQLEALLAADGRFGPAAREMSDGRDLLLLSLPVAGDPGTNRALEAIVDLRERYIPAVFSGGDAEALVTGQAAMGIDNTNVIESYTIPVLAFVLGLSFVILMVVFRSVVVPLKAIVMNLLSVGAAYGLIVLVFLHGVGNEVFGFSKVERVETWIPLFLFAVTFGLSMDYHVFLLTRIRERFDQTGNNAESVAFGVRTTAGMITGAAAIMVAVFAGFAAGETVAMQQMGFGLAVAVFLDATLVRTVLVPASMELLGNRNWYLPAWMHWLPRVDVEGSGVRQHLPVEGGAPAFAAGGE